MPNTRKILIVDDDAELRDALTEQLSLHEEFEAVAALLRGQGFRAQRRLNDKGRPICIARRVGFPSAEKAA